MTETGSEPEAHSPLRPRTHEWLRRAILIAILLAPSVWMLANIPPLWRDLDAYIQVTRTPASAAYMGHGPLYGIFARGPLSFGAMLDGTAGGTPSLSEPRLTDRGIALLIVTQHLLLAGASLALIATASRRFRVRLVLALAWASSPLLPTFAQCVGSESLSMILVLSVAVAGLAMVKSRQDPTGRAWLWFGALLWLALLVRHVNLLLAFALPAALFARAVQHRTRQCLNQAVVATAVSAICVVLAQASLQKLCRLENLRYHSRIGFTFLWRLPFLTALPQETQHQVLANIARRPMSDDAQKLVVMLREMLDEGSPLQAGDLIPRVRTTLFPPGVRWSGDRFDAALNDFAVAFLRPPTREHQRAAWSDFRGALTTRLPEPATSLFTTTAYYFANADSMPGGSGLTTFREWSAEQLIALPAEHLYLRLWSDVRYFVALIFVAALLLPLIAMRNKFGGIEFAACLIAIGVAMIVSTCFIGGILPRYTLPMWETLLIALVICGGAIGDYLVERISRLAQAA